MRRCCGCIAVTGVPGELWLPRIDLDAAREGLEAAVVEAGEAILAVQRGSSMRVGHKPGEGPVTEADYAADDVLRKRLMPLFDGTRWLSEESREEAPLIHGEPTWVVDPLDGTREFLRGIPEWGVSVGLFVDDRLVLGAVGLPWEKSVLSGLVTDDRREARRNGEPLPDLPDDGIVQRVVVSRNDYERRGIQRRIPYEVYPCGSAAVKLMQATLHDGDVYFSSGSRSVWDVAGGAAVLRAVGGTMLRMDGQELYLSPQEISVPPYVAAAPADARALLRGLGVELDTSGDQ